MTSTLYLLICSRVSCWSQAGLCLITADRGALYNHVSAVVVTIVIGLLYLTCRSPFRSESGCLPDSIQ